MAYNKILISVWFSKKKKNSDASKAFLQIWLNFIYVSQLDNINLLTNQKNLNFNTSQKTKHLNLQSGCTTMNIQWNKRKNKWLVCQMA